MAITGGGVYDQLNISIDGTGSNATFTVNGVVLGTVAIPAGTTGDAQVWFSFLNITASSSGMVLDYFDFNRELSRGIPDEFVSSSVTNTETAGVNFTGASAPQSVFFGDGSNHASSVSLGVDTNPKMGNVAQEKLAYDFETMTNILLTQVNVDIGKSGSPSDQVIVSIQTDSGSNSPSGTIVVSSTQNAPSSIASTAFPMTPTSLNAGQKYWVVIARTGSQDASNYYILNGQGVGNNAGIAYFNGSSWVALTLGPDSVAIQTGVQLTYTAGKVFPSCSATTILTMQKYTYSSGYTLTTPAVAQACDGVVQQTVSAGGAINVSSDGVIGGLSLSAGAFYYAQANSSLGTSPGSVTIKVGRALVGGTTMFIRRY